MPPQIKTKEMSLRQYLKSMSFEPKQAEALEKLFALPHKWRTDTETCSIGDCARQLETVLGDE